MRIEDIDRNQNLHSKTSNNKNETKCTKMTDEKSDTSIKNGINGATNSVVAVLSSAAIQVSKANPISSNSNNNNASARNIVGTSRIKCVGGEFIGSKSINNSDRQSALSSGGLGTNDSRLGNHHYNQPGVGGRLQFFKDGKFILELARSSKDGDKCGWISVPRKIFRSPSATSSTVTPTYPKNESSTSLSFSDDNSSIQSSPWQRDHCWKQTSPRRGISKEMCLFYQRPTQIRLSVDGYKTSRIKRRQPYDNSVCKNAFTAIKNGSTLLTKKEKEENIVENSETKNNDENLAIAKEGGADEGIVVDGDNEMMTNTLKDEDNFVDESKEESKINGEERLEQGAKLTKIIQKLNVTLQTKLFSLSKSSSSVGSGVTLNPISSSTSTRLTESHYHQPHVSPRKRILREFEKVSLEDNKRSRAKGNTPNVSTASPPNNKAHQSTLSSLAQSPLTNNSGGNSTNHYNSTTNGNYRTEQQINNNNTPSASVSSTRAYSSYSINSLLGNTHCSSNKNKTESSTLATITMNNSADPSYLRTMLASPKSPENYSHSMGKSSPYSISGKKRSPPYSPLHDIHHHSSNIRSPTIDVMYGNIRSPESLSRTMISSSRSTPPGVHPYLSSPKFCNSLDSQKIKGEHNHPSSSSPTHPFYSPYISSPKYCPPSTVSPNPSVDGLKIKNEHQSSSPNSLRINPSCRSPSAFSHSTQQAQKSNCDLSCAGAGGTPPPSIGERKEQHRTVPKKTVSIRQQFASSPSPGHSDSQTGYIYKPLVEQKHHIKPEERTALSPESSKHGLMPTSPAPMCLPPSSSPLYYYYPSNGSPNQHTSSSSYIPTAPYYNQYAAAVSALRNGWMHYTPGMMPPTRLLPPSFFPYNGIGSGIAAATHIHPSMTSLHLSNGALGLAPPLDHQSSMTDDPVSLISIKEEHSSDVPLNLSKH